MCSSAPDTSGINAAAQSNAQIGQEALDWYKSAYNDQAPLRQQAADTAKQVSDSQIGLMNTQNRLANEADQYRKNTFQPLEEGLVNDAKNFDTDAERERLAGLAGADTQQAFGSARDQLRRQMGAAGIDPSDGAFTSGLKTLAGQEALSTAFNKNKARSDATTLARSMKYDAAALGRGLPSQQATETSLALNAGNAAVGSAGVPIALAQQGTQMMGQGFQTAIGANNSAGNMYGNIANMNSQADSSNNATMGSLASAAAMAFAI